MQKIDKILWATDGSREARYALGYAKLLAKTFDAEIIGLHVIKVSGKKLWGLLGKKVDLAEWSKDTADKWFILFEGIKENLEREELKFTYKVITGLPDERIVETAEKEEVGLIIMGKRGFGLKDRLLVGSNTIKVLRGSQIPVLAVKSGNGRSLPRVRRILVPFDLAEKFDSALRYALYFGKAFNATVSLVYVLELISYPYEFPLNILNEMRDEYDKELKAKIKELSYPGSNRVKIKHKVIESINPYLGIVAFAEDEKPDLIIMNTHGRKGIKRLALGSVAEKVIQEAPYSILALKPSK